MLIFGGVYLLMFGVLVCFPDVCLNLGAGLHVFGRTTSGFSPNYPVINQQSLTITARKYARDTKLPKCSINMVYLSTFTPKTTQTYSAKGP